MNFSNNTIYNSERDQSLHNRYGYNYGYLRLRYPHIDKLTDTQIEHLIKLIYQKGNTLEEAEPYLDEYVKQIRPQWFYNNSDSNNTDSLMNMPNQAETDMNRVQNLLQAQSQNQKRLDAYNNRGFYLTGDQWADVGKATLDGIVSGTESFLDGMSLNFYSLGNDWWFDNSMQKRRDRLQQEADLAGLGIANSLIQTGLENLDAWKALGAKTVDKIIEARKQLRKKAPTLQKLGRQYLNKYWK